MADIHQDLLSSPDSVHGYGVGAQSERVCILILGMHRSGTSALTRVLNFAGAKLPNHLMAAGTGNELGHWEPARLAAYHDELLLELNTHWSDWRKIDWNILSLSRRQQIKREIVRQLKNDYGNEELVVLKEPRICRFAPFFLEALSDAGYTIRVIIPVRHPLEIAASLRKRGDSAPAQAMHFHSSLLWLRHVLDAEVASRDVPRAIVSYQSLLANWRQTLASLSQQLSLNWPNSADKIEVEIQDFLASERRHHRYSTDDLYTHRDTYHWLTEAYATMLTLEHNPYSQNALRVLDQIRDGFDDAEPVLRGLVSENRQLHESQIQELNSNASLEKAKISDYESKVLAYENEIKRLGHALNDLQQKVERRKRQKRELRAKIYNPAKYFWERSKRNAPN